MLYTHIPKWSDFSSFFILSAKYGLRAYARCYFARLPALRAESDSILKNKQGDRR